MNQNRSIQNLMCQTIQARKTTPAEIYLLLFSAFLLLVLPNYLLGMPAGLYFSAPYSGEKVSSYDVTLPITRNKNERFSIPDDCQAVLDAFSAGADRWGNRVERSIWMKVQMDCDYVRFLDNFPHPPLHDFVSNYDFMNAEFQDIALWSSCMDATGENRQSPACKEIQNRTRSDFSTFLAWKKQDEPPIPETSVTCRIDNGIFRGRVIYDPTGTHCVQAPNMPGFRIIAIDYADVNGDDFLDAILRLIPLGRGVRRVPLILPLTRTEPDGVFTIPRNLPGPVPSP